MNLGSVTKPAARKAARNPHGKGWAPEKIVLPLVSLLASIQIVWFYINRVPSYLNLKRYESGLERMPFQGRLLMEYPLRWAHDSSALGTMAERFNATRLFLPRQLVPEDLVQGGIYLICILIAGLVARDLYRIHSRTRLLTPYVFPLVLVMIAGSYCLGALNFFRYLYDLPSLGLFSIGLYLIARRHHPALFAILFAIATVNRESSLFLLFFFLLSCCVIEQQIVWRRALSWRSAGFAILLALCWLGWRIWTKQHFSGLPVEHGPGVLANVASLIIPLTWPQLAGIAGYTIPFILVYRREIRSTELRMWLKVFPIYFILMIYFGVLIEIRLFGEFIPLFACATVLLAEEHILLRMKKLEAASSPEVDQEADSLAERVSAG
jgi:hypothetical protein